MIVRPTTFFKKKSADEIPQVNLAVWLRADFGITKDGGNLVSQWDFKNGTYRSVSNVNQAADISKPTWIESNVTYNNKPTLHFDGNDQMFASDYFSSVIAQPSTYFIVGNFDNLGWETFMDGDNAGSNRNLIFIDTLKFKMYAGNLVDGTIASDANKHIFEGIFDGASSELLIDGISANIPNPGTQGLDKLFLCFNTGGGWNLIGDLPEFIIYDVEKSAGDRTTIRNYLSTRYDIAI